MQRNTPLDYAEFLLSRTRTRCELQIFANGVKEKLASGYFKPFATHLRAAEAQFAKGNQVIRLERPSNLLKKNKVTWFTKGTLERFVRFVSTPEVLERVKSIEDELSQLENVRVALSKTFSQNEVSYQAMDTPYSISGVFQAKGSISMMRQKSSSGADDNEADTSKIELLRAMDVRLVALKQEQNVAFVRAEAAGFDSSNMADLLDFSEHFGADYLRDACIQFITLFRKRTAAQETCQESDSPLADAASTGSDMSLESGTDFEAVAEPELDFSYNVKEAWPKALKSSHSNSAEKQTGWDPKPALKEEKDSSTSHSSARTRSRWGPPARIQINCMEPEVCSLQDSDVSRKMEEAKHHVQNYTSLDDSWRSENETSAHLEKQFSVPKGLPVIDVSGLALSSPRPRKEQGDKQGDVSNKGGMFFTRLQKMAQQVEARRSSEDLGVRFTSVEISDESPGSRASVLGDSSSLFESALKLSESMLSGMVADKVLPQPQMQDTKLEQGYSGTSSMLQENLKVGSLHSGNPSSLVTSAVKHPSIEHETEKRKDSLAKQGEIQETKNEEDKIEENQEKPVMSTSARRLSVQAAISLFESKKSNVGEPPTRKLVRQDSLTGSSTSEKSIIRRWSAVGSNSFKDTQDKAPDVGANESEKVVEMGNATSMYEIVSRNTSLKIDKVPQLLIDKVPQVATDKVPEGATDQRSTQASDFLGNTLPHLMENATCADEINSSLKNDKVPQLAADKSSAQVSHLLRNKFPHLSSAQQLVNDAPDASSKPMPSAQQQSIVRDSATWSSDALQKQFKQELEQRLARKAQHSVRVDDVLPSKSALKTSEVILGRQPVESRDDALPSKTALKTSDVILGLPPVESALKTSDVIPGRQPVESRDDVLPSKSASKTSDVILGRQPMESRTERKDKERPSMSNVVVEVRPHLGKAENQNYGGQNVKITPTSLVASERAPRRQPGLKEEKADYSSAEMLQSRSLKHETDQNVENGFSFKNSVVPEKEPSLALHDTSVDLYMQALVMMIDNQQHTSLSLRGEESYKEQKGRFYEHYLRLRNARRRDEPPAKRAEKEAKLKSMKETLERRKAELEAGALRQKKKGSNLAKEQKHRVQKSDLLMTQRGEEEMGEEEELSQQDQLLHGSKHYLPQTKAQVPKKTAQNLQKSASGRRSTTTSTPSPRTTPKKSTGTGTIANRRKSTSPSYSGPIESSNYGTLTVDSRRDSVRTAASAKPREKISGGHSQSVNNAAATAVESRNRAVDDVQSRTADVDLSPPRRSKILACEGETPHAQALDQIVLESFKGHQDARPEALSSFVTQDVKPSLHQGRGLLPGGGVVIMKQEPFNSKHSLQRYHEEEAFSGSNGYEEATHSVSEEIGDAGIRISLELEDPNSAVNGAVSSAPSSSSDNCRGLNAEGLHLGIETSPDSLDVEGTSYVFEDATNDERILCLNEVDQEKHESNVLKVPGKFSDGDDFLEKESSTIISAEKSTELSQSDSNSSPSVFQDCTTSNYSDAVASPESSFEGHFGSALGAYSPKPALRMGSPLGSPLSWKSFKTKQYSENDLPPSHSSPQKWVSTTSQQPSKEPARGFKRLLHFRRKSRASEAASTGGVSIFTTASGDIETEEAKELMRLSSEELFGIAKKSLEKGRSKDPYVFQDQGATHSLRSSISTPPPNFKPGDDDHLSGGVSSKASRSFFSLSSFRSKGSEGKSR